MNNRHTIKTLEEYQAIDNAVSSLQEHKEQTINNLLEFHTSVISKSYRDTTYFHRIQTTGTLYETISKITDDENFKEKILSLAWESPEKKDATVTNLRRLFQEITTYADSCRKEIKELKKSAQETKAIIRSNEIETLQTVKLTKQALDRQHLGLLQECIDPSQIQTPEQTMQTLFMTLTRAQQELQKLKGIKYDSSFTTIAKKQALDTFWSRIRQVS